MKINLKLVMLFLLLGTASCVSNTSGNALAQLDAKSFSTKWNNEKSSAILIDVRTPEEFKGGHIKDAQNIDYNGSDFESQIQKLDKDKTVFVYCLSGGRSGSAVSMMEQMGFKNIIELEGGMMAWRASALPEEKGTSKSQGTDLLSIISKNDLVLVDFYADWCAPCKKMKPVLNEFSSENKILVTPLNADVETELGKQLNIINLPTLILFKKGKEVWRGEGYRSKQQLLEILQKFK